MTWENYSHINFVNIIEFCHIKPYSIVPYFLEYRTHLILSRTCNIYYSAHISRTGVLAAETFSNLLSFSIITARAEFVTQRSSSHFLRRTEVPDCFTFFKFVSVPHSLEWGEKVAVKSRENMVIAQQRAKPAVLVGALSVLLVSTGKNQLCKLAERQTFEKCPIKLMVEGNIESHPDAVELILNWPPLWSP